jgi:uncharacterized coiled-coil DUF342 family protein
MLNSLQKAVQAKLQAAQGSKDSPAAKERTETLNKIKEIRAKQGEGKAGRGQVMDKIKKLDESMRADMTNLKNSKGKLNYKGLEDVDRAIESLDKQVNGGMMKLVDEKKALAEISSLRKQRKQFSGFDDIQKNIDSKKADIKKLRDSLDDPESKALSDEYTKLQEKYDALKAEHDEAYKNINFLRDERTRLHKEQQETFANIKQLKDDYYHAGRAAQKYDYEQRQKLRERKRAENEAYHKEKKVARASEMLAEAREPAYLDEIRRATTLLAFLDSSYKQEKAALKAASGLEASAQRKVDDSGIKGTKVVKKEEEDYFAGTGGKKSKGKKNKKATTAESPSAPSTPTAGKYNCPPSVMEGCAAMGIEPPMTASEIPSVTEKVKAKLDHWMSDQAAETQRVSYIIITAVTYLRYLIFTNSNFRTSKKPKRKSSALKPKKMETPPQARNQPRQTDTERPRRLLVSMKEDLSPTKSILSKVLSLMSLLTSRVPLSRIRSKFLLTRITPPSRAYSHPNPLTFSLHKS